MKRHTTRQRRALTGRRGLFATAAAALTIGTLAVPAPVDAGEVAPEPNVVLEITVEDPDGGVAAVVDAITPEFWVEPDGVNVAPGACSVTTDDPTPPSYYHRVVYECTLPMGQTYRLGDASPPDGFSPYYWDCENNFVEERIADDDVVFTLLGPVECVVDLAPTPVLHVDTVVVGGDATPADFAIEVYDDTGVQVDIGTVSDTVVDNCSLPQQFQQLVDEENCAAIPLELGTYTLGSAAVYGYELDAASCSTFYVSVVEQFDDEDAEFIHGESGAHTYCTITMAYETETLYADLVVVNDSGGTADGSEFTIEVFDDAGVIVASGPDPEPGTGNAPAEFELPIGPYTLGVSGPDGYDGTAEVVLFGQLDQIPGEASAFTMRSDEPLFATITVDDQTDVATTTSTTTTTTTVAPSTLAPTTASTVDPNAVLPATGSSSTTTWTMLLIALGCLGAGGLTIAGTRRR